jgi:hypothetical protein
MFASRVLKRIFVQKGQEEKETGENFIIDSLKYY